jgi:uncharacterized membrane protein
VNVAIVDDGKSWAFLLLCGKSFEVRPETFPSFFAFRSKASEQVFPVEGRASSLCMKLEIERMRNMRVNTNQSGLGLSRLVVAFPILLLTLFVFQNAVKANVRFCNKTGATASVAIAYVELDEEGTTTNGHRGVTVEGWWSLEPNECKVVSNINAGDYSVYYYAHSSAGMWEGRSLLCIASRRFQIGDRFKRQNEQCPAGFRLQGFRSMETNAKNHTHNLTN